MPEEPDPKLLFVATSGKRPGTLIHVDIKQLPGLSGVGHRNHPATVVKAPPEVRLREGNMFAFDDANPPGLRRGASQTAEAKQTVGFLARAVGMVLLNRGSPAPVLSDNGPSYRSDDWRKACRGLDLETHLAPSPYTPQTNR